MYNVDTIFVSVTFQTIISNIIVPMDMTVVLGLHKFSLRATIDHHGTSMYSGQYSNFITIAKTFYCNDSKIA